MDGRYRRGGDCSRYGRLPRGERARRGDKFREGDLGRCRRGEGLLEGRLGGEPSDPDEYRLLCGTRPFFSLCGERRCLGGDASLVREGALPRAGEAALAFLGGLASLARPLRGGEALRGVGLRSSAEYFLRGGDLDLDLDLRLSESDPE